MNVFFDLQGWSRGVRDDQVRLKNFLESCKFLVDRLTERPICRWSRHVDRKA